MELSLDQIRQARREAKHDPLAFARGALGIAPWDKQATILRAVAEHDRVAVRSGHKIGKSTAACVLALWWVCTRRRARVVMTSASYRQVKSILWKELRRLNVMAGEQLAGAGVAGIGGEMALDPETGLQFEDGREIVGLSTKEPEKIAGYSGPAMLFILDEASGIPEPIFEALEGDRAGGAKLVMFSNPTRTSGTFFDAFHAKREFWRCIHVSSEDTPNVREGRRVVPGLATREWVEEKRKEWGEASPLFQVRVRGNFPSQADNAVISLAAIEEAVERWESTKGEGRLHIGVDVARFGDDETVIQPRRGHRALRHTVIHGKDIPDVAAAVMAVALELRVTGERPLVKVDECGLGAGVYDILKRNREIEAVPVNVAEVAQAEGFSKLRDQLWFGLGDWIAEGGAYERDVKLDAELVAPTYSFDSQGRRKVASKDEMKKVLGRSPDRADALGLAVFTPSVSEGANRIRKAMAAR